MAGRGTRLRPHTLTTPKPLIPVAGKPIIEWLVKDIIALCPEKVDKIGFIIGDFGVQVENDLIKVAESFGAQGKIYYQDIALGTAHAILCAQELLTGKTIVAFADTLFKSDFKLDTEKDGVIFVHQVEDPKAFGVVKMDETSRITDFVEKPQEFVSPPPGREFSECLPLPGLWRRPDSGFPPHCFSALPGGDSRRISLPSCISPGKHLILFSCSAMDMHHHRRNPTLPFDPEPASRAWMRGHYDL